ncbi:polysaccharide pyruvyl transferase family protein [Taklimakanibacter deserti]|uniref:polysaccharide pyruvyl transferase family protein n=1 Tax=Taklimakanibacter deserti TaxID=2267839 RepID=UPI000E648D6B
MKAPIAVVFANLKGNLGDFAILHAMLLEVRRRFPENPVHVFSHGFRDVDKERLMALRASNAPEFEHLGSTYSRNVSPKLRRLISKLGIWPLAQPLFIRSLAARSAANAARFREYEAIFLCGGDMWCGVDVGISMFATLTAIHEHNDQIYAYPFSINPKIFGYSSKRNLQRYLGKIRKPLVTRDEISKSVLDKIGVASISGADCVFSLQSLASDVEPAVGRDRTRVLIVCTGKEKKLEADLRSALQRLNSLAGRLALLTTSTPEDGKIYEALSNEFGIPFYAPKSWQETVAEIKASSLVVTNRLHGLILSSLAGTAVLPVTNRKKVEAFVIDTQVPYSAADINKLSTALVEECLMNRDPILERMTRYRDGACEMARGPVL